jgi:hypothetical protein
MMPGIHKNRDHAVQSGKQAGSWVFMIPADNDIAPNSEMLTCLRPDTRGGPCLAGDICPLYVSPQPMSYVVSI